MAKRSAKKWVFQELVKPGNGELNVIGLVAYSLYKAKKDSLASELHKQGDPEEEIQRRLDEFHDNVSLNKAEKDDLILKAKLLIDNAINTPYQKLVDNLNEQVETQLKKLNDDKAKFELECDKERKKIQNQEANKLKKAASSFQKPSLWIRFFQWVGGGFAGVFATIITGIIIMGLLTYNGSPEDRAATVERGAKWILNTATGNPYSGTIPEDTENKSRLQTRPIKSASQ